MDFLKTCMTNVLQSISENNNGIRFSVYSIKDDSKANPSDHGTVIDNEEKRQTIAHHLTRIGMLARAEPGQNRIWCFNQAEGNTRMVEEQGCSFVRDGTIESKLVAEIARQFPPPAAPLHVFRLFAAAVDALISFTLSKICTPMRVKSLVWLVTKEDLSRDSDGVDASARPPLSLLVQVCMRIAANGSIVYLPEVATTTLRSCDNVLDGLPAGGAVGLDGLVAPVGTPVKLVSPPSHSSAAVKIADGGQPNQTDAKSNRQAEVIMKQKERMWKALARTRLRSMMLGSVPLECLDDNASWTWVELDKKALPPNAQTDNQRRQIFLWPTSLCAVYTGDSAGSQAWSFAAEFPDILDFHDILASAEAWFNAAEARRLKNDTDEERRQSYGQTIDDNLEELEADALLNSPLYSRGPESTSVGGVYPTPPDGIIPNVAPESSQMQTIVSNGPREESLTIAKSPAALSHQSDFNIEDDPVDDTNGDLFGESEETFEGPGITDDDFSFFDDSGVAATAKRPQRALDDTDAADRTGFSSSTGLKADDTTDAAMTQSPEKAEQTGELRPANTQDENNRVAETFAAGSAGNLAAQPGIIDFEDEHGHSQLEVQVPDYKAEHTKVASPPLSPFAIKERMLPLPIPASAIKPDLPKHESFSRRRNSNFGPVDFNVDFSSANSKYGATGRFGNGQRPRIVSQNTTAQRRPSVSGTGRRNISLPEKLRVRTDMPSLKRKRSIPDLAEQQSEEESEYDSESDDRCSPATRSSPKKWQPGPAAVSISRVTDVDQDIELGENPKDDESISSLETFIQYILSGHATLVAGKNSLSSGSITDVNVAALRSTHDPSIASDQTGEMWSLFKFDGTDLMSIGQLVAEQSHIGASYHADSTSPLSVCFERERNASIAAAMQNRPQDIIDGTLVESKECSFASTAAMSASMVTTPSSAQPESTVKIQPRPPPRRGVSMPNGSAYGQYIFPMPAPYVRINRSDSAWDMLHTALEYWDVLGLEPCYTSKNVRAYCVMAGNVELAEASKQFLNDLGTVYEAHKLGAFSLGFQAVGTVALPGAAFCQPSSNSPRSILVALRSAAMQLAEQLTKVEHQDQTTVVYMVDPFEIASMTKYICACFWELCKSYPRRQNAELPANVVLHIVPMSAVALPGRVVIPDARYLKLLAHSTFDKSPQSPKDTRNALWQLHCAPSFKIVPGMTRKINFALNETPPTNLMQEAQILHLSYAISPDGDWLSAAWTDYTGQHQHSASFCLARADHQAILVTLREWTISMLPDKTTWRLIVARLGSFNPRERALWAEVAAAHIAVTLVDITLSCPVRTMPTTDTPLDMTTSGTTHAQPPAPGAGLLTPGSTPQATSQTVSPDAQGHTAASAAAPDIADPSTADPDAHLLDTRDETWALILPFSTTHASDPYVPKRVLASGIMLRRGEPRPNRPLPSLGVDVVENIQPKTPVGQSSWLIPRSGEGVLREVLVWYRGLALLARLRGVRGAEEGVLPWHVGVAVAGARGLDGFLDG